MLQHAWHVRTVALPASPGLLAGHARRPQSMPPGLTSGPRPGWQQAVLQERLRGGGGARGHASCCCGGAVEWEAASRAAAPPATRQGMGGTSPRCRISQRGIAARQVICACANGVGSQQAVFDIICTYTFTCPAASLVGRQQLLPCPSRPDAWPFSCRMSLARPVAVLHALATLP